MSHWTRLVISIAVAILAEALITGVVGVNSVGGAITYFTVAFVTFQILPSPEKSAKSGRGNTNKRN